MSGKTMDVNAIMEQIPHRYPFLLVDRVIDYESKKWIKAIKNVTVNEFFFRGHFPERPIMPGVLMVEALAQAGGILMMIDGANKGKILYFMTIDNAKFRKPVVPGDQLLLHVSVKKRVRKNIVQMCGEASVDGKVVCEADLMFSVAGKE